MIVEVVVKQESWAKASESHPAPFFDDEARAREFPGNFSLRRSLYTHAHRWTLRGARVMVRVYKDNKMHCSIV